MRWYLDASALLKFYKSEDGTENVYRLFESYAPEGGVATSQYTAIEAASALQRLCNAGQMDASLKERLLSEISASEGIAMLPVSWDCLRSGVGLISKHNLRGGDAVQLSSALECRSAGSERVAFVCSDARLNEAARKEGLDVYDPVLRTPDDWLQRGSSRLT